MSDPDSALAAARASDLLPAGRRVVVMLSGGRDSVCLLGVAVELAGADVVSALHFNYGLRPGADDDELHCRALCEELGVALEVQRAAARPASGNLQAWARELRYGAARRIAERRHARIATGHTGSDQVETILYRLAASPGRRALLGMPAREGEVVRPLLAVTREDTAAWCRARGLSWREDPTNQDVTYARARVRERLVPELRELHPAAEANVLATAELLSEEAAVLDALVDEVLRGEDTIEVSRLAEFPLAVQSLVARRLAEQATGGYAPGAARRINEVLELAERTPSGALDLGGGARAVIEGGVLRFEQSSKIG